MTDSMGRPTDEVLGRRALELVFDRPDWMHRRKESIVIVNDELQRRTQTVDFEQPPGKVLQIAASGEPIHWLPLFFLPKLPRQYSEFDFEDENGRSLPLPTRSENGRVSGEMLVVAAERALAAARDDGVPGTGGVLTAEQKTSLRSIAAAVDPAEVERHRDELDRFLDRGDPALSRVLNADACFRWLYREVGSSSVVVVPLVGAIDTRKLLKLSFDEVITPILGPVLERVGWEPYNLGIDLPFVGARTFHVQAQAPAGMQIIQAFLATEGRATAEADIGRKRRAHLYLDDAKDARKAYVSILMRTRPEGFVGGAVLAAFAVAALLTFCAFAVGPISRSSTSAPSLLLALPGAIAAFASRSGDHPLTSRLLRGVRALLITSAGFAFAGAAAVAIHKPGEPAGMMKTTLIIAASSAWVIVGLLSLSRRLPVPSLGEQPLLLRVLRPVLDGTMFDRLGMVTERSPTPEPHATPWLTRAGGVRWIPRVVAQAIRRFARQWNQAAKDD